MSGINGWLAFLDVSFPDKYLACFEIGHSCSLAYIHVAIWNGLVSDRLYM